MTKEEYVETLYIKNKEIKVGIDDYGQCYFFEYIDDNGETQSVGCGAYNTDYLEDIYGFFDDKGTTISIYGIEAWNNFIDTLQERYNKDPIRFRHLKNKIDHMKNDDYELYDFDKMYKERGLK